ncbi:hypothetical protein AAFF_G00221450 [Aldrovandia affinis]|uniref:Uncharacterized protein n=1 Tax=Aldrovandia affinis TaxID=143900 RepID=A0AAD7W4R8_9TELE|nr:hypothetical protein AAFF_G00221450 [Aldrovandia affinis]
MLGRSAIEATLLGPGGLETGMAMNDMKDSLYDNESSEERRNCVENCNTSHGSCINYHTYNIPINALLEVVMMIFFATKLTLCAKGAHADKPGWVRLAHRVRAPQTQGKRNDLKAAAGLLRVSGGDMTQVKIES